jgi:hypothetical protein
MTKKPTPDFAKRIPPAAGEKIVELRKREDLTPEQLAALDRLATYEVMHTEVWQRLPPRAAGMEGQIIEWTIIGVRLASAQRPPFPKSKAKIHEYVVKYPPILTAQDAAWRARSLVEAMDQNRQNAEEIWATHTQQMSDGQARSYLEVRNIVEWLTHFFEVL